MVDLNVKVRYTAGMLVSIAGCGREWMMISK
jgi:hypothetical protein